MPLSKILRTFVSHKLQNNKTKKMKRTILALGLVAFMASCSDVTSTTDVTTTTDTTSVSVDTTSVSVDTCVTDTSAY